MVKDACRMQQPIRDITPCKDCPERFIACADRCPKDERGEFGIKAWKAELERVKATRKDYLDKWRDNRKREERIRK